LINHFCADLTIFITSALTIIPLAIWLNTATEQIAIVTGAAVGKLLNAVFGNVTELIIGLVALKAGLIDIVKTSRNHFNHCLCNDFDCFHLA
jgi:Ca2+:H+ antiporter